MIREREIWWVNFFVVGVNCMVVAGLLVGQYEL